MSKIAGAREVHTAVCNYSYFAFRVFGPQLHQQVVDSPGVDDSCPVVWVASTAIGNRLQSCSIGSETAAVGSAVVGTSGM